MLSDEHDSTVERSYSADSLLPSSIDHQHLDIDIGIDTTSKPNSNSSTAIELDEFQSDTPVTDDDLENAPTALDRSLTLKDGVGVVVGIIIGSGIFASPGLVLESSGSSAYVSLVVWLSAGLLVLLGGLCFAELGAAIPVSGGSYEYYKRYLGKPVAFAFTWVYFFVIKAGAYGIICLVFARYFGAVIFSFDLQDAAIDSDLRVKALALAALFVITVINIVSVRLAAMVQNALVGAKSLALLMVLGMAAFSIVMSLIKGPDDPTWTSIAVIKSNFGASPFEHFSWNILKNLGLGVLSALWAYDGYTDVTMVAEEIKEPGKNIPRAIILGCLVVIVAYAVVNVAYLCVLTTSQIVSSKALAVDIAYRVTGTWGAVIMSLLVAASAFGTGNGSVLTGARSLFAAARDGLVPFSTQLKSVNPTTKTPIFSLVVSSSWSAVVLFAGNFEQLIGYFGFCATIFYALAVLVLVMLRFTHPELERPFKLRPFPLIPGIYMLVSAAVIATSYAAAPRGSTWALLFLLSSFPVYYAFFYEPAAAWWSRLALKVQQVFTKAEAPRSVTCTDCELEIEMHESQPQKSE